MTPERAGIEKFFRIPDESGVDRPFLLRPEQERFDEERTLRDIILKARQLGFSSFVLALYLIRAMGMPNRRVAIISHERSATQRLLYRIQYMVEHFQGATPKLKYSTKNEMVFPRTGSMIFVGTAGAEDFGVGDTITDLLCSELARWDNPKPLMAGLLQAVPPNGSVVVESTGRGTGNYHHRFCMNSLQGKGAYKTHFYPWNTCDKYRNAVPPGYEFVPDPSLGEEELLGKLDVGQLLWRRDRLVEMDFDLSDFQENYPLTLQECFQSRGASYFSKIQYDPENWKQVDRNMSVLESHPRPNCDYLVGADVGGGVGLDSSVIEVFCVQTSEQVGEWVSNRIAPDAYATKIAAVASHFNEAWVNPERNNHGLVTLELLVRLYEKTRIRKTVGAHGSHYGTLTTVGTRPILIGRLRHHLAHNITIHSPALLSELGTFVEKPSGKVEAQSGSHDDRVLASALALVEFERMSALRVLSRDVQGYDPFSLDAMLSDLASQNSQWMISAQS